MSKTQSLFKHYHRILREQGEQITDEFDTTGGEVPNVTDTVEPDQEEMPMTSEGEDRYIADMIDAALYSPTPEDSQILTNLQSVMKMKRFKNAREEVLPTVLGIIRPESDGNDLRDSLNNV